MFARALSAITDADEARWALYYGVKQLAKSTVPGSGSFEAKLFYNFLDERYGEDELAFFLYWCVVLAGSLAGGLVAVWVVARCCCWVHAVVAAILPCAAIVVASA